MVVAKARLGRGHLTSSEANSISQSVVVVPILPVVRQCRR